MNYFDWLLMGMYLLVLISLSYRIGKTQSNEEDYYLGSRKMHWFPVGISTMATQLSTNSMLGAPAFVAFSLGGGLLWLQYELAVPLAMIFVMIFLVPFFKTSGVISIYEYLGKRFGSITQVTMSMLFQFVVAFGTGVTVYGISLVLQVCLDIPFWTAVALLGVVTIIYDTLGGIKSVIISDVLQMTILVSGIIVAGYFAISLSGGLQRVLTEFPMERFQTLDFSGHGLGDNATFAFLPMLIGGFFLYVAYYGCNQTQVQRQLSTKNLDDTNMALFLNGLLRFPIVLMYCFLGVAIGAYAAIHPEFISQLPTREIVENGVVNTVPNYNTAVPIFVLNFLPHGIIGLIMMGLFAAAMSSLDSTLNSLSATTIRDIVGKFANIEDYPKKRMLLLSKGATVFWGVVCITFAFYVGNISDSIIVSINKISSLANGPLLATFLLGILTKRATDKATFIGIIAGFCTNLFLWLFVPEVSWLWWNVIGCVVTFSVGYLLSLMSPQIDFEEIKLLVWSKDKSARHYSYKKNWILYYAVLLVWFAIIIVIMTII